MRIAQVNQGNQQIDWNAEIGAYVPDTLAEVIWADGLAEDMIGTKPRKIYHVPYQDLDIQNLIDALHGRPEEILTAFRGYVDADVQQYMADHFIRTVLLRSDRGTRVHYGRYLRNISDMIYYNAIHKNHGYRNLVRIIYDPDLDIRSVLP